MYGDKSQNGAISDTSIQIRMSSKTLKGGNGQLSVRGMREWSAIRRMREWSANTVTSEAWIHSDVDAKSKQRTQNFMSELTKGFPFKAWRS